ncbi:hypothetical protein DL96DRAFT_1615366 [Flagelloscypha sp. PMI_526]|nr:hypothetical protein DL96DRAFT_1615366 [Flagelloscypha sp. PMI_526]
MNHGGSFSVTNLPFDIRERILETLAWSSNSEQRLALMLLSKDMYYLISKVQYRIIFFSVTMTGRNGCSFELLMEARPPGFFQGRVEALWLSLYLAKCSMFLNTRISTFQRLQHVGFNFSRGKETQESMYDAIRAILSIPLESIWIVGGSLPDFGVVLGIKSRNENSTIDTASFASFHALRTVTHFYAAIWLSTAITQSEWEDQAISISHLFVSVSHIALNLGSFNDPPSPRMVQWLLNRESFRLIALIAPIGYRWQADQICKNVKQDREAKVVFPDPWRLPGPR